MAVGIVASNKSVEEALTNWINTLDDGDHRLRLFSNDITPTPGTLLDAFVEATYAGYTVKDPSGTWGAIYKVLNGLYQTDGTVFNYAATAGADQTVYGWYIDDGVVVRLSRRFNAPILMKPDVTFSLQIFPQGFATSILE